ncbi:MAG: hypothetical protein ACXW24_18930 [Telluria sp.]
MGWFGKRRSASLCENAFAVRAEACFQPDPAGSGLCCYVDILNLAHCVWYLKAVFPHTFNVQSNSLSNFGLRLFDGRARRNTSWQIRDIGGKISLSFFDNDCESHTYLTFLNLPA